MTTVDERRLADVLRIMVPRDAGIAPGFLSRGREGALAQVAAAFRRINEGRDHGR